MADAERNLNARLKWTVDKTSANEVLSQAKKLSEVELSYQREIERRNAIAKQQQIEISAIREKNAKIRKQELAEIPEMIAANRVNSKEFEKQLKLIQSNVALRKEFGKQLLDQGRTSQGILNAADDVLKRQKQILRDHVTEEKKKEQAAKRTADQYKRQQEENKKLAGLLTRASSVGTQLSAGLIAGGTAVSGGIFALGASYVKNAKESDEVTRRWLVSQKEIEKSQERIARVAAQTVLPVYRALSQLTGRIAGFIEQNPQAVQIAFGAGVAVSVIGLLGIAVSKGIKLVADGLYVTATLNQLAAAKIMDGAANKQLAASSLGKGGLGAVKNLAVGGTTVGSIASIAATTTAVIGAIVGGAAIGGLVNDILAKNNVPGFTRTNQFATGAAYSVGKNVFGKLSGESDAEVERKSLVFAGIIGKLTGAIDEGSPLWEKATSNVKKMNDELKDGVAGSANEEQIVKAYETMLEREKKITEDAEKERVKIVEQYEKSVVDATRSHQQRLSEISRNASSQINSALSQNALTERRALEDYSNQRAEIARSGGEEIVRIEQDLQENLRKLQLEHDDRIDSLIRSRDALGYVKEQRDFSRKQLEEERGANLEIRRRRQETARRLQELQLEFNVQRERRAADLASRLEDIRANAAEQRKIENENYQDQLKKLREAKALQLRELEIQKQEELKRNRASFIQLVRDLDASLLGERQLRIKRYNEMLEDVDKFLSDYKSKIGQLEANVPGRSEGGYASGLINTGEKGYEYVLNNKTTKIAENIFGGSISQESIIAALKQSKMNSRTLNITDQRRFDRMPPRSELDRMNKMQMELLEGLLT